MQIIITDTNLSALYKAVDNCIAKHGASAKYSVPESIKGQSALTVIKSMFGSSYFSYYDFSKLVELHGVDVSTEHDMWLRTLSGVRYEHMHPDTKEYLFAICVQYFKSTISMTYTVN